MELSIPVERTLILHDYLQLTRLVGQHQLPAGAEAMQELLDHSELVSLPGVPATLVTMHTEVLLEDVTRAGRSYQLTLCYPQEARPAEGLVSVLSPVGASLLGLHVGAIARWRTPAGEQGAARILAVLGRAPLAA
jgi:regulator of nucleoside diphosphate kinase